MQATATPSRRAALKEYRATDNGDGTYTIHDVELVGPMPAGDKPDGYDEAPATDRAWMNRVVKNHMAQLVGGFVAPVHDVHMSDAPLGTVVPTVVRSQRYEGQDIDVLFGDVTVDRATLDAIRAGAYPYRSIEVARWQDARITSLAFLKASGPYWRFPMLKNIRVEAAQAEPDPMASPELAAMWAVVPTKRAKGFRDVTARLRARELATLAAFGKDEGDDEEADDEGGETLYGKGDDEDKPAREDASGDPAAGNVSKLLASLMALMTRVAEKVLGGDGGEEDRTQPARDEDPNDSGELEVDDDEETEDEEGEPNGKPKEKAKMNATQTPAKLDGDVKAQLAAMGTRLTTLETANATLANENATLKADLAGAKASIACKELEAASRAKLRAKRVIVPENFGVRLAKLHAQSVDLATEYVADLEANGRQDPPDTFNDEIASSMSAGDPSADPALTPYRARGAAVLESAVKSLRDYRAYKAKTGDDMTAEKWLKTNVPLAAQA